VERALLSVVREDLLALSVLQTVADTVRQALREMSPQRQAQDHKTPWRRAELQAEIDRLVDAISKVGLSQALHSRLALADVQLVAALPLRSTPPPIDVARFTQQPVAAYKRRLKDSGDCPLAEHRSTKPRSRVAGGPLGSGGAASS
jgi:hypothetical protein